MPLLLSKHGVKVCALYLSSTLFFESSTFSESTYLLEAQFEQREGEGNTENSTEACDQNVCEKRR